MADLLKRIRVTRADMDLGAPGRLGDGTARVPALTGCNVQNTGSRIVYCGIADTGAEAAIRIELAPGRAMRLSFPPSHVSETWWIRANSESGGEVTCWPHPGFAELLG